MHYTWVEAIGFLKWRWACSCGEHGEAHRRFRDAAKGQMAHGTSVYVGRSDA